MPNIPISEILVPFTAYRIPLGKFIVKFDWDSAEDLTETVGLVRDKDGVYRLPKELTKEP